MSAIHEPSKMALRLSSSQDSSMIDVCFSFFLSFFSQSVCVFCVFVCLLKKMMRKKKAEKQEKRERGKPSILFSPLPLPPPPRARSSAVLALASFFMFSLSLSRLAASFFFSLSLSLFLLRAFYHTHASHVKCFLKKKRSRFLSTHKKEKRSKRPPKLYICPSPRARALFDREGRRRLYPRRR